MAGLLWYRSYMDSLANTSGYYPDIHAGHADRVAELTLDAPYLVRETPAGYNQLELMELVGGSVAWNQLCSSSSVTGTSGHKFYLKKSGAESITNTNTFTGLASGTDMVTDLTLMLGSAIADYVYSLEQATAEAGIAWLKSYGYFTEDYIAYSAPTLQSVEATSHVTKDANDSVIATYPLDSDLVLRGIPKLSNGNLYYDGDTYEWDGTVNRKYKEVTFDGSSDENWNVAVSGGHYRGYINISDIKPFDGGFSSTSMLYKCSSFVNGTWENVFGGNALAGMTGQNLGFGLDALSITDSAGLKTWLSSHPIELIYELATQTTEFADPFTAVQTVEDGGTEEFVTTNGVPVGNVSVYRRA